jgi:transposase
VRSTLEWTQVRAVAADGVSQREIAARLGINRRTVRRMLDSDEPPRYRRAPQGSKLDPFEPVLRRVLEEWPQIKAPRMTELLREQGYAGSVDLVKRRLRELRPRAERPASRPATARARCGSSPRRRSGALPAQLRARQLVARAQAATRAARRTGAPARISLPAVAPPELRDYGLSAHDRQGEPGQGPRTAALLGPLLGAGPLGGLLEPLEHAGRLQLGEQVLLVVDEVGYLPLERQAASLLFALVSRRYERGSIIVTSNRSFEQWGEILGDAMVAAALIDRLVQHATMVTLKGKSFRLRERGAGIAPAAQDPSLCDSA